LQTGRAIRFFGPHLLQNLFEDLHFERLLSEKPVQLADLLLQGTMLGGGHDFLPGGSRCECALRC
jgi:hypothetical protein